MRQALQVGKYQFQERLGEGGSGQVYRATAGEGAPSVAVKILAPGGELDEASAARFKREILALGQLAHPNLVRLLDHGIDDELGPYLVLPLLDGKHLRALAGTTSMCPEAAILLARPIVAATTALHAAGYVHRDLKPENVIAGPDGTITVIDLGLAWRDGMTRHTESGAAVGSIGYMAPEQIDGRPVDGRADVYAIASMLYEWIAGKRPFARARPAEEAAAVLASSYAPLAAADRRVTDELSALVDRCLAKDPAARPTAAELGDALDELVDWTSDVSRDRARVVADPAGFQLHVAPIRVQRAERRARECLAANKPFLALAHCDRGLAYSPEHPALGALIREAEEQSAAASRALPVSLPTTLTPRTKRLIIGGGIALAACAIALVALLAHTPEPAAPVAADLWNQPMAASPNPSVVVTPNRANGSIGLSAAADADKVEMFKGMVGLLGRAVTLVETKSAEERAQRTAEVRDSPDDPTTANGWLARAETQPATEAIDSIRRALVIEPGSVDGRIRLCVALSAAGDDDAVAECDRIALLRPDEVAVLGARGVAYLRAGRHREAIADLDRVVAKDPDERWGRIRAKARQLACAGGDAAACADPL